MYTDLNPGVGNHPVITYAHLNQVYNLPGCILSIEKGVKPGNDTIKERRLVREVFRFIYPTSGVYAPNSKASF